MPIFIAKGRKLKYFCFLVAFLLLMFIPEFRNFVLKLFWPKGWVSLSNYQILKIVFFSKLPLGVSDLECSGKNSLFKRSDIYDIRKCEQNQGLKFRKVSSLEASSPFHPIISVREHCDLISLYVEMSYILAQANLSHFLAFGSLIGVYRHRGIIPWDDDIDIAANGLEWEAFRRALSCVEGYKLRTNPNMHWKFSRSNSSYPFIDIFFYTEDENYVWFLTSYVKMEFAHVKKEVFPLTVGMFEDITVPLPAAMETIVQSDYEPVYCQPPSLNHKSHTPTKSAKSVLCATLNQTYDMYNV
ncbi:uncharacterized protein LOC106073899 [Biomphalaria glabrata]|uniref:Uncharacterized protein LOC106073899 n=1 Tax=Biomphalaria glabrata TaxID=6526 RepID=A0A9U8EK09_BIOGL|nr:uncharacterized protein LOC106073899 [Biomphalaria glabrata]XP_013090032.2 uncharacterized protein LOC106073899 [Biomphalaria glabrata]XP_013090033.2 uncharacterized protein LOC106073899 [Biomphalaria glabrata]XP_055899710.1 uncharacterized protein LOC106073899 [Biomphalaria glabrata]XP_055899711.1 uncharacterized protein LOC106073899 [Biomphalaria glabrata]